MSLGKPALNQHSLFTTHIKQAKAKLHTQAPPDYSNPVAPMPKTCTTSECDVVKDEFMACHKELEENKDAILAADAGQPHKAALDDMLSTMVTPFIVFACYHIG